jgi:hypothetical protein
MSFLVPAGDADAVLDEQAHAGELVVRDRRVELALKHSPWRARRGPPRC